MFERFTDESRSVLVRAGELVRTYRSPYLRRHHLLIALIDNEQSDPDIVISAVLEDAQIDRSALREALIRSLQSSETPFASPDDVADKAPFSAPAKKVLELSLREALTLGNNYIDSFHLLLGILRFQDGPLAETLKGSGLDYERARAVARRLAPVRLPKKQRGRGGSRRGAVPGPTSEGYDAVISAARAATADDRREVTTGDLLVALAEVSGTHAASMLASVSLPTAEMLRAEADRLIVAKVEDGTNTSVHIDDATGAITVTDPVLAKELKRALEGGETPREALKRIMIRLGLFDEE